MSAVEGQPAAAEDRLPSISTSSTIYDELTPIEENLAGRLDDLIRQGKVRYIGNSNFPAWARRRKPSTSQRAINVNRFISCPGRGTVWWWRDIEKDLLPAARQYNLGLLPFFPLASSLLTGKYKARRCGTGGYRGFGKSAPRCATAFTSRPRNEDIVEKLQGLRAGRGGHSMLELGVPAGWRRGRKWPASSPAPHASSRFEQNVKGGRLGR